jgi:glycosyltransferase involved in cell wall biosynthesis
MTEKKNKPMFTIVVPVCRTEQFFEQCLVSIKNQIFENFECIVVNDGSLGVNIDKINLWQDNFFERKILLDNIEQTKQCKFIFDKLVSSDSRFKYIEQKNQGVCVAKNTGIELAKGKYIQIVDSDDWIKPNFLLTYVKTIIKYESENKIVFPHFYPKKCYNSDYKVFPDYYPKKINTLNQIYYSSLVSWNNIQILDVIKKYNVRNDPRLGSGPERQDKIVYQGYEDLLFSAQYLEALELEYGLENIKFVKIDDSQYMYRDVDINAKNLIRANENIRYLEYYNYDKFKNSKLNYVSSFVAKRQKYLELLNSQNKLSILKRKIIKLKMNLELRLYI